MRDYIAGRVKACAPSTTVKLMAKGIEMKKNGLDVQVLSGGEPDFDTPQRIKEAGIKAIENNKTHYTPSAGIIELRYAISEKLWRENGIKADPFSEIIVTPSSKTALFQILFTFLELGDEVMLFEPNWISYKAIIELTGAACIPVPLKLEDNFTITREILESRVTNRTKMLVLGTPCNPTGRVMTREEADIIAEFIEAHDVLLLVDELYERLIFDGRKNISLMADQKIRNKVITLNGYSKGYAMTGWRLGYCVANPEFTAMIMKLQDHMVSCSSSISQYAALEASECEADVKHMVREYQRRRDVIYEGMRQISCVTCQKPEGAFYLFCKVDYRGMTSMGLCDYILEEGNTLVAPGDIYGAGGENCIRLSFAASMDTIRRGIENMQRIFAG